MNLKQPTPIIGLVGKAGSGKDYLAKSLIDIGFTRVAFGDPIRLVVQTIRNGYHGMAIAMLRSLTKGDLSLEILKRLVQEVARIPFNDTKDREALQVLGTQLNRLIDTVWIDAAWAKINTQKYDGVIVTDVRRESEYRALENIGALLVAVDASESVRFHRLSARDHISRADFDKHNRHVAEAQIERLMFQCLYHVRNDYLTDNAEGSLRAIIGQWYMKQGLEDSTRLALRYGGKEQKIK